MTWRKPQRKLCALEGPLPRMPHPLYAQVRISTPVSSHDDGESLTALRKLHVLRHARLAILVRVDLKRLRVRGGERVLGAVERGVDVVVVGKVVALELPGEEMEVDVRHGLARSFPILSRREKRVERV